MKPKILALLLLASCAHKPTWEQATEFCFHEYGQNADALVNAGAGNTHMHTWESGAYDGCLFGIMEFHR